MSAFARELREAERRAQRQFHMRGPSGGGMWGGGGPPPFNGNFAAVFESFPGLTVRVYRRGDLGVTGTTGTGKTNWANQHGDGSTMAPGSAGASNGIGSVGAGLNSKASVVTNGATQNGSYTLPSSVAPATTNHHIYAVERILVTPVSVGYMHSANTQPTVDVAGGQVSPRCDMLATNGGSPSSATPLVINQWYRLSYSLTGSINDRFQVGSQVAVAANGGNGALGTQWGFGAAYNGTVLVSMECVLKMHIEGPLATYLTAKATVDPLTQSFWTAAIQL
jgi:hypothetical protein